LGGLVETRRSSDGHVSARSLGWPKTLRALAGYSGNSANTRKLLARLDDARTRDATGVDRALSRLGEPVALLQTVLEKTALQKTQLGAALWQAVDACHQALCEFDQTLEIGIITPGIREMVAIARRLSVAAKVSGAGGGDSLIALSDDSERLEALAAAWQASGFMPFDIGVHQDGVCVEKSPR
jgi:phosphomevalonate kinase